MNKNPEWEMRSIRESQRLLQEKLDALQARIDLLESQQAEPESVLPDEPLPVLAEVAPEVRPTPPPLFIPEIPPPLPKVELPQADVPIMDEPVFEKEVEAPEKSDSLELRLGRVWLVRVGIVILLTGLVFLGNFAWAEFVARVGPLGKLVLLYLAGLGLGGFGWFVQRKRAELSAYGKVLVGGGIATIYYATYAAHFVEPLRVISSPLVGGIVLMALALGIVWLADRIRSQAVAVSMIVLSFYTAAINPVTGFSLFSNLVLSAVAITLLVRRQWVSVSFLSLIGCYGAFAFWRMHATGTLFVVDVPASVFWTAFLFPACYWLVFTISTFLGGTETFKNGSRPAFLTINNGAFFALTAPLVAGTHPDGFWMFPLCFGAVVLFLAFVAGKRKPDEAAFDGSYLTQGLVLISLGILFKFSGYQLALILALQGATLLKLSGRRHDKVLQFFSALSATVAAFLAMHNVVEGKTHAALTAGAIMVVLIGMVWLFKWQRGLLAPPSFQWRAEGGVLLATALGLVTLSEVTEGNLSVYLLVAAALAAVLFAHLLRTPELLLMAQAMAVAAILAWVFLFFAGPLQLLPFIVLSLGLLALMHWWQHQQLFDPGKGWKGFWQAVHSLAFVGVISAWIFYQYPDANQHLIFALSAWLVVGYAFAFRAWALAVCSQLLTMAAAVVFLFSLREGTSWPLAVCSIGAFVAQSLTIDFLATRVPESFIEQVRTWGKVVRWVALVMALLSIQTYVPPVWHFLAFVALAFGLFVLAAASKKREALYCAGIALIPGYAQFLLHHMDGGQVFVPDFAGLFLVLLAQQVGRRAFCGSDYFDRAVQGSLIIAGIIGLWIMTGRMVADVQNGFLITASWGLLAFMVMGAGFILRERAYRVAGLGILACALGRLFLLDVWQLETIFRILSFLVLGMVLVALGFFYNRFAEQLRKWL